MAARQQPGGIHVGDGAGAGDRQVASYQNCTDRRSRNERLRLLRARGRRAAQPCNWCHPQRTELVAKTVDRLLRESAKDQRRLDGLNFSAT